MNKFAPLCLKNDVGRALVNSGHILPCCYMDYSFRFKHEELPKVFQHLTDEELNISNAGTVEDIFNSNQWKNFLQYMQDAADEKIICEVDECNSYCRKKFDHDPTAERERVNE